MSEITPHPAGVALRLSTIDERHTPHLKRLTDMVHEHGAKIIQLLHNLGRQATSMVSHHAAWAPSALPGPGTREVPHEMDLDNIQDLIRAYVRTSQIIQAAGYDGIEIMGAHGFLLGSFLSPASNKRPETDPYGGSLANRMRLIEEIIAAIREACGRELVLGLSFSVDELNPQGLTVEETTEIARRLEAKGQLNYLSARIGDVAAMPVWIGDMTVPQGAAVHLAAALKRLNCPS